MCGGGNGITALACSSRKMNREKEKKRLTRTHKKKQTKQGRKESAKEDQVQLDSKTCKVIPLSMTVLPASLFQRNAH